MISRIPLDRLRENAYQVFPIPRPSYMLEIYGLRMNLSDHRDFEDIHVINMPRGFSDTGHRSHASTPRTTTSIQRSYAPSSDESSHIPENFTIPDSTISFPLPQEFASDIPSTSELGSPGARLDSNIPSHDFSGPSAQSPSDLTELCPNILQAIRKDITRIYPSSKAQYEAAFTVRWELDQYLETELDFDPKNPRGMDMFDSVLTITGMGSAAYATNARSYIQREWPDSRVRLLDHLQQWAHGHSPYISKSFVLKSPSSVKGYALLSA